MLPRLGAYAPRLGAYATGLGVYATFVSHRGSFDPKKYPCNVDLVLFMLHRLSYAKLNSV